MDQQTAALALAFLQRVQLTGAEVPAFNAVVTALGELAEPPETGGD